MTSKRRLWRSITVLLLGVSTGVLPSLSHVEHRAQDSTRPSEQNALATREEAYRANNLGVALLEQYKYKEASAAFRRALQSDEKLAIARVNLSLALYNERNLDEAAREARAAAALLPDAPQPHYLLGLIARAQNRVEEAIAAFRRVLAIDKNDVATNVNLGQLHLQQGKFEEALSFLRAATAAEPFHVTAVYNLALALLRSGQREEGQRVMKQFETLRQSGYGTTLGQNYLEQGRYAEALVSTGAEPELVDRATPDVQFTDATASLLPAAMRAVINPDTTPSPPRAFAPPIIVSDPAEYAKIQSAQGTRFSATPFDFDGDGDLDLFLTTDFNQQLLRNDGGRFVDVTDKSSLPPTKLDATNLGVVAGDYDNDGKPDLFVLRWKGNSLYHNDGDGKFSDVTTAAGIPDYPHLAFSAAFVDVDHDGDLDIFIAGHVQWPKVADPNHPLTYPDDYLPAPNLLLRNNGNGRFTDITAAAQVGGGAGRGVAVVPTDYDNRRDVDLLVLHDGAAPVLFKNSRDGTFRDVAADVGLNAPGRYKCVAAGDVNKDGFTDFFFGRAEAVGLFALSDGHGRFKTTPAPIGSEAATAAQFLDYDNDGLSDLMLVARGGLRAFRHLGDGWADVSDRAVAQALSAHLAPGRLPPSRLAAGDFDGDGDTDLIMFSVPGALKVARNDGGNRNRSLRVQLAGKVSNRGGVGAKVEVRAGSLWQKLETYAASPAPAPADIVFGLGQRAGADAVRVLWPAGIVQAETQIAATMTITELDRKPSSCPYLYTWNGERFEFVTDFMGGGEMGYWHAPGVYSDPDPVEYVRIRDDQLKPRAGRYEIRVTNELEEVLYVDRLQLIAVAHPADVEVFPNEGMTDPPRPFKLWATRDARPPVSAMDDHGHDVWPRLVKLDRQYPDDFRLHHIRGYAEEHTLTLDLGEPTNGRTLLLLTGWTDYAFSSDNVAAHQQGLSLTPPALQVKDGRGRWQTRIADIGIPVGRPQTMVVDLTGKFLSPSREARIVTNMRIYWDQIRVATMSVHRPSPMTRLDPLIAELRWRGFSAEVSPDGREPFSYDYDRVSFTSPWKVMPGRYTREGDVRELLLRTDDRFVISRPGDEIVLSFDATALPSLPSGWQHTFLLYADGFSKEMDINSASPDVVMPLPFHGMKQYPYSAPESYPMTRARRESIDRYNTRVVTVPVPPL